MFAQGYDDVVLLFRTQKNLIPVKNKNFNSQVSNNPQSKYLYTLFKYNLLVAIFRGVRDVRITTRSTERDLQKLPNAWPMTTERRFQNPWIIDDIYSERAEAGV